MGMTDLEKRLLKGNASLPDLATLPVRVPRDIAADLLSKYFFQISPRSLERWPLIWRRLNGKAHCETIALFAMAGSMVAAAPPVIGGSKPRRDSLP